MFGGDERRLRHDCPHLPLPREGQARSHAQPHGAVGEFRLELLQRCAEARGEMGSGMADQLRSA